MGGWGVGVVGKSDFKENPKSDLDLRFVNIKFFHLKASLASNFFGLGHLQHCHFQRSNLRL